MFNVCCSCRSQRLYFIFRFIVLFLLFSVSDKQRLSIPPASLVLCPFLTLAFPQTPPQSLLLSQLTTVTVGEGEYKGWAREELSSFTVNLGLSVGLYRGCGLHGCFSSGRAFPSLPSLVRKEVQGLEGEKCPSPRGMSSGKAFSPG